MARVVHVIKNLPFDGGTTQYLFGLLNEVDPARFPSEILVLESDEPGRSFAPRFEARGIPVTYLHMHSNLDGRALQRVVAFLRERRAALVQTHLARSHIYGGLAALLLRLPLVVTEHGIWRNVSTPVRIWDNLFGRLAARIVCNSDATQRQVHADLPLIPANRLVVIYPGVSDWPIVAGRASLTRQALDLDSSHLVLGHAGTFNEWRRQGLLVQAFAEVYRQEPRARLVLLGEGPLQATVKQQAQALGLAQVVLFLGARSDARQVFSLLDAYVNPATAEAFGIATVEAMLAGLPVVVADACALPELITHEISGLVVPPDDASALTCALLRVLQGRAAAQQWGQAARQIALTRFSPRAFAQQFEAVYRDILGPAAL